MNTVLLVDGTNSFIRNYVTHSSTTSNGAPYGGVVGFLRSLRYHIELTNAKKVVIAFDAPGGSKKRRAIFKDYKKGRKPAKLNRAFQLNETQEAQNKQYQFLNLLEYLQDLPVTTVCIEDIEADDVIAYLAGYFPDYKKVIISSDHDFYQLLESGKTEIFIPTKKVFYTEQNCLKEFGIHPVNFALARAMAGDKSDCIPGVKGIGLKMALRFFDALSMPKKLEPNELIEICSQQENKKYLTFVEHRKMIETNYAIMRLDKITIGTHSISQIKDSLKRHLNVNNTAIRLKLMRDGIDLGINFFRVFLELSLAGKKTNV